MRTRALALVFAGILILTVLAGGPGSASRPNAADPVQDLVATGGPNVGQITVDWNAPTSSSQCQVTSYRIDGSPDGLGWKVLDVQKTTLFIESGLYAGALRHYRVTPYDCHGAGASATTHGAAFDLPGVPQDPSAAAGAGGGEITVGWGPPLDDGGSQVTSYAVFRNGTMWAEVQEPPFVDGGLGYGETHGYQVAARSLVGLGPLTDVVAATTFSLPDPPQLWGQAGLDHYNVSWGASPDDGGAEVQETRLYGGDDPTVLGLIATAGPTGGTHIDATYPAGHTRYYAASAVTVAGEGPLSSVLSLRIDAVPMAPYDISARAGPGPGEVTLRFALVEDDPATAPSHVEVHRGTDPTDLALVVDVLVEDLSLEDPDATSRYAYVDSGLADGTAYHYLLIATNSEGASDPSPTVFASTHPPTEPPAPLPSARTLTAAVQVQDTAFVIGGLGGNLSDGQSLDEVVRFDLANESNEVVATMPSARHATSAAWVPANRSAYIFFGDETETEGPSASSCHPMCHVGTQILKFAPDAVDADASASSGATFQIIETDVAPRHSTASVYVPPETDATGQVNGTGLVYVFGGLEDDPHASARSCHPGCHVGAQIGVLDPATDTFEIHSTQMPQPMWGMSAVYVPPVAGLDGTGLVYLFGGHEDTDGTSASSCHPACHVGTQILSFDPRTAEIQTMADALPSERWYTSATFDGTYAYVFGGVNDTEARDEILRFDPRNGEVLVIGDLPSPRGGTSTVSTANRAYIFGGDDLDGTLDEIVRFQPSAPQSVTASAGPGPGAVSLDWRPPVSGSLAGVTGYHVYAGTTPTAMAIVAVLPDNETGFVHTGLGDGATWYYRVSAITASDEGPQSVEVRATTFDLSSPPRDLEAERDPLGGIVDLVWSAPADDGGTAVVQYDVYRSDGPGQAPFEKVGTTNGTTTGFADHGCTLGKMCTYRVVAVNIVGESAPSEEVAVLGTRVV
ncbi:MAG: hypothetical protein KY455_13845 [Euryarchaeota archaeon]|nr:hypothetical protein [Euryarchaeota archaeon]